jgi:hypothetical protein
LTNFLFDYAAGRWVEKYRLPIGGDNIILVLLKASGLQADATLQGYQFLGDLLAAGTGNLEATFTNYSRKVYTSADITVLPPASHITTVDITDPTWTGAGGAVNNDLGALLTCYRQTSTTPDSQILLLTKHDWVRSTTGVNMTITVPSIGTAKWSLT